MGILLPSSFPHQVPRMTSRPQSSSAPGSQQVQLSCLCPARGGLTHPNSGSSVCHKKQEPTAACQAGGVRIWSVVAPQVQKGCVGVVLVWSCKMRRPHLFCKPDIPFMDMLSSDHLKAGPVPWKAAGSAVMCPGTHTSCSPGVRFHCPSAKAVQLHAQSLYPF